MPTGRYAPKNRSPEKQLASIAKANERWLKSSPPKTNAQKNNPPPIWGHKK
jgi:hypothetical protein